MKNPGTQEHLNQLTMLRQSALDCPVDGVKVNANKVRTIAFFVLQIGIAYLFTSYWLLPLVLVIDFALRAFDYGKFSPLAHLSDAVVSALHFPIRLIDQAPKRFAAGVGLVFTSAILILHFLDISTLILTVLLLIFAALESLAGFCAGCYVYTILKRVKIIN